MLVCYLFIVFNYTQTIIFSENKTHTGQTKTGKQKTFTSNARKIVSAWYTKNRGYPYPTKNEATQMAEEANITTSQVIKWLSNKRFRTNNTMKTISGVIHPRRKQKMLRIEEVKENPAADVRWAATEKSRRYFLKQEAVNVLERWYNDHKQHPYPTDTQIESLALEGDITVSEVSGWFDNKRNRCRTKNLHYKIKSEIKK